MNADFTWHQSVYLLLHLLNARTVHCLVIEVRCSEDVLISSRYMCQLFADFLSKAMPLEVCFLQQRQNLTFRQFQVRIKNPHFQAFCNSSVCKKDTNLFSRYNSRWNIIWTVLLWDVDWKRFQGTVPAEVDSVARTKASERTRAKFIFILLRLLIHV